MSTMTAMTHKSQTHEWVLFSEMQHKCKKCGIVQSVLFMGHYTDKCSKSP